MSSVISVVCKANPLKRAREDVALSPCAKKTTSMAQKIFFSSHEGPFDTMASFLDLESLSRLTTCSHFCNSEGLEAIRSQLRAKKHITSKEIESYRRSLAMVDYHSASKIRNREPESLFTVLSYCNSLLELDLDHTDFNDVQFGQLAMCLCLNCHDLRVLILNVKITALKLAMILGACPKLEHLQMQGWDEIDDEGIRAIGAYGKNLRVLDLSGCDALTDEQAEKFLSVLPRLEEVYLDSCETLTDRTAFAIAERGAGLKFLDLTDCLGITDDAITAISRACINLRFVKLEYCDQLSDAGIGSLANCAQLKELEIMACDGVSDETLQRVAAGCSDLVAFRATGCDYISDTGVISLVNSCTLLSSLWFGYCTQLTDVSLRAIGSCCRDLSHLELIGCKRITDKGLEYVAVGCSLLDNIDVSFCSKVTEKGIRTLLTICEDLTSVAVVKCRRISPAAVTSMRADFPDVEILY